MNYINSFSNIPSGSGNQLTRQAGWELFFKGCADQWFDIATSEGIDPIIIMSWALNESDWGTSNISCDKANLWGWGAVDGNAYNSAKDYSNGIHMNAAGAMEGLRDVCQWMYKDVTDPNDTQRYQKSVAAGYEPDSLYGVGVWYCSDPKGWAENATVWMKYVFTDFVAQYCRGGGDFLEVAEEIWVQVCTTGKYYEYGGANIPVTGPTIDCSSYVSWVLYEYGYTEFEGTQKCTQNFYSINWTEKYGWTEIPVAAGENPIDKLQPGDIFVRDSGNNDGHIQIFVEYRDGRSYCYDCGNTNANWNGTDGSPVDKTYFLTTNKTGKIIRVTNPN